MSRASLTGACGVPEKDIGLAEVLGEANRVSLSEILFKIGPNLNLVPADLALAPLVMQLKVHPKGVYLFREILKTVADCFDIALIDCAPNLGLLTIGALAAKEISGDGRSEKSTSCELPEIGSSCGTVADWIRVKRIREFP